MKDWAIQKLADAMGMSKDDMRRFSEAHPYADFVNLIISVRIDALKEAREIASECWNTDNENAIGWGGKDFHLKQAAESKAWRSKWIESAIQSLIDSPPK